jgi:hypothetical protein
VDFWNGTTAQVQTFIAATGVTFPLLRQGGFLAGSDQYGITYDNYVVVDPQGIVRYTSVNEIFGQLGRFNDAHVRAAILAHLPLPVRPNTWAGVKALFR